jgi:membrane dipeptidase
MAARLGLVTATLLWGAQSLAEVPISASDRLMHDQMLVLDTHLDTPMLFERDGWRFGDYHELDWDASQVDIPRMEAGGLDGGFFVIYTESGPLTADGYAAARDRAFKRAAAIQRVVAAYPDKLAFATTADDATRIAASGKLIVFQSLENCYPLGTDVDLLQAFHALGVRMAGPVHFKANQFADSATDKPRWNGLSKLGRKWVAEMNRLGMIIDASHASDEVFDQLLLLSKTPIILSHSGPKAIFDHGRNIDDDRMRRLAAAGGVMQIYSVHLQASDSPPGETEIFKRQEKWATLSADERRQLMADKAAVDAKRKPRATFDMFMASLLHAIKVMGVDHVGVGNDWDGGGGVAGMEDVASLPKVTARLREAGYSEADIEKIWSGNVLRLLRQAEDYAASQKPAEGPTK